MNLASIVLDGVARGSDPTVRARALTLARSLEARGVGAGARVALWLPDRELTEAFVAVVHRGAVAVPLSLRLGVRALAHHLRVSGAEILVAMPAQHAMARDALALAPNCRELLAPDVAPAERSPSTSCVAVDADAPALLWFAPSEPEDLRGELRDHGRLSAAIAAIAEALRVAPGEVVSVTPASDEGCLLVSLAVLSAGARLVEPDTLDPAAVRTVRVPAALAAAAALAPDEELLRPPSRARPVVGAASAQEVLDATLPRLADDAPWLARASTRSVSYPTGCGRGASMALEAGLKPMLRELIAVPDLEQARARFEAAGWHVEISPLVFGRTADGWLGRPESREETRRAPADDRRPMYVGPDRSLLARAVRAETSRTLGGARELGMLLGYPACCVDAFVAHGDDRRAHRLWARALERTERGSDGARRPCARLNVLDHAIFSYLSWFPCRFDCEASLALADGLASVVAARHPGFVEAIDRLLGAPRLVLAPEVQLSLEGEVEGDTVRVRALRATATDRDPRVPIEPRETGLAARALAWLDGARRIAVRDGVLWIDDVPRPLPLDPPLPLLVPFAAS